MKSIASQFMLQLSHEEKLELLADLKAAIADEVSCVPRKLDSCPRCGCPDFVKKGRDADGSQRWACKGCARTFSAKSGSLLANSKLGPCAWMAFAECMADGLPLRESAARCGVSLYTSWFMRMRVCEVMRRLLLPARAGTFHVDGTLVRDNLSGTSRTRGSSSCAGATATGRTAAGGRGGAARSGSSWNAASTSTATASAMPSTAARRVRAPSPWTLPRGYPKGPRW
ncbi:MAG: hypothetical protein V8S24_16775 [Gordonibacter pamelaeae]